MRETLVLERIEQDAQRLVVAFARLLDRHACFQREPRVSAADAELVAAVDEHVERSDLRREDGRIVVRQDMNERAELDVSGPFGRFRKERKRIR